MGDKERARPFYCGSQHRDWVARNCERCVKYDCEAPPKDCEIDAAIGNALFGDGTVSAEIAARMGYSDPMANTWDCPERLEDSEEGRAAFYRQSVEAAGQLTLDAALAAREGADA